MPVSSAPSGFRDHEWPRFLSGPGDDLVQKLYGPALSLALRYDRCCAYFSSSVLAAAARGFRPFVERLLARQAEAPRPAIRLLVNEALSREDADALLARRDTTALERQLKRQLRLPADALGRRRLELIAWLVKEGFLEIRVGILRHGEGLLHAKFGILYDDAGDVLVFRGSGNETGPAIRSNYEMLEVSTSWEDMGTCEHYTAEFRRLWEDQHPHVASVRLPDAIRERLIRFASDEPHLEGLDPEPVGRRKALALWTFLTEAPYLPNGAAAVDALAPVDLWPHQREVVDEVVAAWPEGRLLCDEVGMGKTIEALMVVRRLMAGRGVRRILFLVPAGLLRQWQEELREKGGLLVPRYEADALIRPGEARDRMSLEEALQEPLLLLSRELARTPANQARLLQAAPWDLVVLDEAHAARRRSQKEGEFNQPTLLLSLLRRLQLSGQARSYLLLSATPMQTHPWEPWDLLAVLGEGGWWLPEFRDIRLYFEAAETLRLRKHPDPEHALHAARPIAHDDRITTSPPGWGLAPLRDTAALRDLLRKVAPAHAETVAAWLRDVTPLQRRMHRNTRQVLRRYFERGLIDTPPPRRSISDVRFSFRTPDEEDAYQRVQAYVDARFADLEEQKPGKGFVMTVYRRRAASSWYALRMSLERRRQALLQFIRNQNLATSLSEDIPDLLLDDDLPDVLADSPPSYDSALPDSPRDAESELRNIDLLLGHVQRAEATDTKRDELFAVLRPLLDEERQILVFTEYYDTLVMLRDCLTPTLQDKIACYSGRGGEVFLNGEWHPVLKKDITTRLADGSIRVLLCTDAASEGLNLQSASALINYDLPWNPARVEQRIGRIDRIGQRASEVRIFNLLLEGSVDDRVYQVLQDRCGLFTRFVGPMQPVLQEARRMLLGQAPPDPEQLRQRADAVDPLAAAAYAKEDPVPDSAPPPPPVTREDLADAATALAEWSDFTVRIEPRQGILKIRKGTSGRYTRYALTKAALEADPDVRPLVLDDPFLLKIPRQLRVPGDTLPLIVATHEKGAHRRTRIQWVGSDGSTVEITSYKELRSILETWDGSCPSHSVLQDAQATLQAALAEAVETIAARVQKTFAAALRAQLDAARIRLLKELGRYLVSLGYAATTSGDLNRAFYNAMTRLEHRHDLILEAYNRLGDYPTWPDDLLEELRIFARQATDSDRQARLLGSPLEAALADPRWQASPPSEDPPSIPTAPP